MTFMVIESYKDSDPRPVYARFAEKGRLMPEGISYVNSWVTSDLSKCYQVMEGDLSALNEWMANWNDLVDFEVIPMIGSAEAAKLVAQLPS